MSIKDKAMDVYSWRMDTPFSVAAYCRGHKFSVEAVNYARAIRRADEAEAAIALAQKVADAAEKELSEALKAVQSKMEREPT